MAIIKSGESEMDLVKFLEVLTLKDVHLGGVHPEVGVYYELQLRRTSGPLSGRKSYIQVKWTKEPRSFGGHRSPCDVYSSLNLCGISTFDEMHTAAMAVISQWWQWWTSLVAS